jgi:hypothetical protein
MENRQVFGPDQEKMLELMFDRQAYKIADALSAKLDEQIGKCKDTRPCNSVKIDTLATKEEVKPENLLDYKKAPVFWLKVATISLLVNSISNSPITVTTIIEFIIKRFT